MGGFAALITELVMTFRFMIIILGAIPAGSVYK